MSAFPITLLSKSGIETNYSAVYFALAVSLSIVFKSKILSEGWSKVICTSIICGYAISLISVIVAALLLPEGIERLVNSSKKLPIADIILVYLTLPIGLVGWIVSAVAVSALKLILK